MIRANNLTICIPNYGCQKSCPYCVSKMTNYFEDNKFRMKRNRKKVRKEAEIANVNSILITGKAEPFYSHSSIEDTRYFISEFSDFPVEVQTNGIYFYNLFYKNIVDPLNLNLLFEDFYNKGLDTIAISIDSLEELESFSEIIYLMKKYFNVRITLNVTSKTDRAFIDFIYKCQSLNIDQFTLRKIVAPNNIQENHPVKKWIDNNADNQYYDPIMNEALEQIEKYGIELRRTNFGTIIYDLHGISFSHSEYCIQEYSNSYDLRSLILGSDGHLYSSWNSKASKIF